MFNDRSIATACLLYALFAFGSGAMATSPMVSTAHYNCHDGTMINADFGSDKKMLTVRLGDGKRVTLKSISLGDGFRYKGGGIELYGDANWANVKRTGKTELFCNKIEKKADTKSTTGNIDDPPTKPFVEVKGTHLYREAAEKGDVVAMNNLASVYDGNGYGEEAVRWYRKAADKGYETAMYNLGWMYEKGRGVKQDRQMAAQYIIDAIRKRNKNTAPYMAADVATWSKQFRLELQRLLQAAGVYDGSIDGSLGPGTRRAMQALAEKSR